MNREEYQRYLASREWALLRERVRKRCASVCERCKRNPMEAVHHLTYARIGRERLEDLMAICNPCHAFESGKSDVDPAKRTIYLAGKCRGNKMAFSLPFENRFAFVCSDGFDSKNQGFHFSGAGFGHGQWGWGNLDLARKEVMDVAVCLIAECDELIAYLDTPDSYGSIAEIAYASALRKRCAVFIVESKSHKSMPSEAEDAYLFVCGLPYVSPFICKDMQHAQDWVRTLYFDE